MAKNIIRHTLNNIFMTLAFIGILGLFVFLSTKYKFRTDMTEAKQFTLSERTIEILRSLDTPIHITAFYLREDPRGIYLEDLLEEFARYTDEIEFQFIDPELEPAAAQRYQITTYNTVVFEVLDKRMNIFVADENALIRAIARIASPKRQTVYFLSGHGERDPDNAEGSGYSQIRSLLEMNNFDVKTLNLATKGEIPSDIDFLVIASPLNSLMSAESEIITRYLNAGGRAILLQDPGNGYYFDEILKDSGVQFRRDIVSDPQQALFGIDPYSVVVDSYPSTPITQGIAQTVFYGVRSLQIEPVSATTVTVIAQTSDESLSNAVIEGEPDVEEDTRHGPLPIFAAIEYPNPSTSSGTTRLIVGGDSDFASNMGLVLIGNADLFTSLINWVTDEEIVSTTPRLPAIRYLTLTPGQSNIVLYGGVILMPLIMFMMGGLIWWRQR
jgi:ABC-type uncharacterized transport system involved in gliding motility auxiliary subunit